MSDLSNAYLKGATPLPADQAHARLDAIADGTIKIPSHDSSPLVDDPSIIPIGVNHYGVNVPPVEVRPDGVVAKPIDSKATSGSPTSSSIGNTPYVPGSSFTGKDESAVAPTEPTYGQTSSRPEEPVHGVIGYGGDIARGVYVGANQGVTELGHTLANLADFVVPDSWQTNPHQFTDMAEATDPSRKPTDTQFAGVDVPSTTVGKLSEATAQFIVGLIPALRAVNRVQGVESTATVVRSAKQLLGAGAAGNVAYASVFNPLEERISNHLAEFHNPILNNAVTQWMKSDKEDPILLNRIKMLTEGYVVGKVGEKLFQVIKLVGQAKIFAKNQLPSSVTPKGTRTGKAPLATPVGDVPAPHIRVNVPSAEDSIAYANSLLNGNEEAAAEILSKSVDLSHISTEKGILDLVAGIGKARDAALGKHTRTWKEAAEKAKTLGANGLSAYHTRTANLDSFVINAGETLKVVSYKIQDLAGAVRDTGSAASLQALEDAAMVYTTLNAMVKGANSEVGRALNAMKYAYKNNSMAAELTDSIAKAAQSDKQDRWKILAVDLQGTPRTADAIERLMNSITKPTFSDAMNEMRVNNLFSPITYAKNLLSNTASLVNSSVERYAGALVSQTVGSKQLTLTEANTYTLGLLKGVPEGLMGAVKAWKTESPVLGHAFMEDSQHTAAFTKEAFGITDESSPIIQHFGKGLDLLGTGLRSIPGGTRSLLATDEFFKGMIYRGELNALAIRESIKDGFVIGTKEFQKNFNEVIDGASKGVIGEAYHGLHFKAIGAAERGTFTENFGEAGEKLLSGLRSLPLSYIVLPFVKTPVNLIKYVARRLPGISAYSDYMTKELTAGGARADLANAQMALGTLYTTTGLALAAGGYLQAQLTNNMPARRNLKELGVVPQSIAWKNGDQTPMGWMDGNPMSFLLYAAAVHETAMAYIETHKEIATDEEMHDALLGLTGMVTMVGAKYAMDKSWTQGMAQALNAIQMNTEDVYAKQVATSFVPFVGTANFVNKQWGLDPILREADTVLEEIRAKIPGLSNSLPPVPDVLGQPSRQPQNNVGGLNPATTVHPTDDPVVLELARLQKSHPNDVVLGGVTRNINGVKLDGVETWNFNQFMQRLPDDKKQDLSDGLNSLMESKLYKSSGTTDTARENMLKVYYETRKKIAKIALQQDSLAYANDTPRPKAEEFLLWDYKRSLPIGTKIGQAEYSKAKDMWGSKLPMSQDQFVEKRNLELVRAGLGLK